MPYYSIVEFGDCGYTGRRVHKTLDAAKAAIVACNVKREERGLGGVHYSHIRIKKYPTGAAAQNADIADSYPTVWTYA